MSATVVAVTKARRLTRCSEPSCDVYVNRSGFLAVLQHDDDSRTHICRTCASRYPKLPSVLLTLELRFTDFHPPITHRLDISSKVPEGFIRAFALGGEYIQWAYQLGLYHGSDTGDSS